MHITFEDMQKQSNIQASPRTAAAEKIVAQGRRSAQNMQMYASGIRTDLFGQGAPRTGVFAYGKEKSAQEFAGEASLMDGTACKNYMAVMSHTMSAEDYKEMTQEGIHPGRVDVGEAVTIMDHIKANMAKSGVIINGFNGAGDLSMEVLEQITGDAGYAQAIAASFAKNDIPLTQENVSAVTDAVSTGQQITGISDEMKQYLLENELPPTIDALYKAMYSVSTQERPKQGGYFIDDASGYYGKLPQTAGKSALDETQEDNLKQQIDKMLRQADFPVTEETRRQAYWMLDRGILLTQAHMENLQKIEQMEFPVSTEELTERAAQAIGEGKAAMQAALCGESLLDRAVSLQRDLQNITDESLYAVISSGKAIHIRNLSNAQREINLSPVLLSSLHEQTADLSAMEGQTAQEFVHERRVLEETRLQMTVSANLLLLKSGYAIDTAPLSSLVEALKEAEARSRDLGLTLPDDNKTQLYRETMEKKTALMDMPAAVTAKVMSAHDTFTLRRMHEEGSILKSTYEKAGESYEALMTAPRADLGDRIRDAFSNIDELLAQQDMEDSEENRRAVRILAYNQMELSKDNIEKVRDADQMVTRLLNQMTPVVTLNMIRNGVNPLDSTIAELTEYLDAQEDTLVQQTEKFSRFLYKLEQENGISKEERDAFVGIYRLIRQVEKGDRRAIGRLVDDGRELSFANLLSAVRTGKKKPIDLVIDDSFGALKNLETKGVSISDQINRYFEIAENQETEEQYTGLQYEQFRHQMESSQEYVAFLTESGVTVSGDNLEAAGELMKNRGGLYRNLKQRMADHINLPSFEELISRMQEHFTDAENALLAMEEMTEQFSSMLQETMFDVGDYLDIKAITSLSKQLSLTGQMAKNQVFELPAIIDGELTSVNVRFTGQKENEQPNAKVHMQLTDGREMRALFVAEGDKIKGFVTCNDVAVKEKMEQSLANFRADLLSETGKNADITIVQSDTLEEMQTTRKPLAGKQRLQNQSQAQSDQGREADAGALYQTVRSFVKLFE